MFQEGVMRSKLFIYVLCLAITVLVFQGACKTSDEAEENRFTLTVILGEGVSGDPVAGTYTYDQGDVVNYSFTLGAGYGTLTVTLDGTEVAASGTVAMNADHVLSARAGGCAIDIRGKWKGIMVWPLFNPITIYDVYFDLTFYGDLLSGLLVGNADILPLKDRGIYTVDGCDIRFEIETPGIIAVVIPTGSPFSGRIRSCLSPASSVVKSKIIFWGAAEDNNRITGRWDWDIMIFYSNGTNGLSTGVTIPASFQGTFWLERE
jgi:hypothetical protein